MKTVKDSLLEILDTIVAQIKSLLDRFSKMNVANRPENSVVLISPRGNHFWQKLPVEGKQLQTMILKKFKKFSSLMDVFLSALPDNSQKEGKRVINELQRFIEQDGLTWCSTKEETIIEIDKIRNSIREIIDYFASTDNNVNIIPDTNALIFNPDIEKWSFKDFEHFCIILVPAVLAELDHHKINHRNENVREKAKRLIKQIKDYRRRGNILDGVTIKRNCIILKATAIEPDMNRSLSWFDRDNPDDRFLATVLEIMKEHFCEYVFIVTRDINMQNKAEIACIPYLEPPGVDGK